MNNTIITGISYILLQPVKYICTMNQNIKLSQEKAQTKAMPYENCHILKNYPHGNLDAVWEHAVFSSIVTPIICAILNEVAVNAT